MPNARAMGTIRLPIRPRPTRPRVRPASSGPIVCCHPPSRTERSSSHRCRDTANSRAQVNSSVDAGEPPVPHTVTPRSRSASRSTAALTIPVVTSRRRLGRRWRSERGNAVRSRIATITSNGSSAAARGSSPAMVTGNAGTAAGAASRAPPSPAMVPVNAVPSARSPSRDHGPIVRATSWKSSSTATFVLASPEPVTPIMLHTVVLARKLLRRQGQASRASRESHRREFLRSLVAAYTPGSCLLNEGFSVDVEIWSDIACPWCYIGKRRFEAALARFEHRGEVRVIWRSFELDPEAPHERAGDRAVRLAEKYAITIERAREMEQQLTGVAAGEGVEVRFDIARSGATFDAHRIIHLAGERGLQDAMKERLLRAYFTEGELVSDHQTLARMAVEVGLTEDEVSETLAGERYAEQVRDDEQTASQLGIRAVPTFVIDRALGASGAQPPDALLDLLRQGWANRSPVSVVTAGEACGIDGC